MSYEPRTYEELIHKLGDKTTISLKVVREDGTGTEIGIERANYQDVFNKDFLLQFIDKVTRNLEEHDSKK